MFSSLYSIFNLKVLYEVLLNGDIIIPILQIKKLRH